MLLKLWVCLFGVQLLAAIRVGVFVWRAATCSYSCLIGQFHRDAHSHPQSSRGRGGDDGSWHHGDEGEHARDPPQHDPTDAVLSRPLLPHAHQHPHANQPAQ